MLKRTHALLDLSGKANALADALNMEEEGEEEEEDEEGGRLRLDLLKGPRTVAQRKVEDARDDVLAVGRAWSWPPSGCISNRRTRCGSLWQA